MSFLPPNYSVPTAPTDYLKLTKKEPVRKLRILTDPILGFEYFNNNGKPVRSKEPFVGVPKDIGTNKNTGEQEKVNHFWAMVVWDYAEKKTWIWSITQVTIQRAIENLFLDEDWGDPKGFDIKVTRTDAEKVSYAVIPSNKGEVPKEALQALADRPINLLALYTGQNPFDPNLTIVVPEDKELEEEAHEEEFEPDWESIIAQEPPPAE
jgi:hypothetical protein